MFKTQLKFQKILAYALLIVSVAVILYALGLLTDIYRSRYNAYDPAKEGSKYDDPVPTVTIDGEQRQVTGGKLFYDMQEFNGQLLTCSIAVLLVSLTNLITNGQKRRKYYIGNYISVGLITVANIVVSIWCMTGISKWRAEYLTADFEALKVYNEAKGYYYTDSTVWFDAGYVIFAVLLVVTALLVLNCVWKISLMKKEQGLLDGKEEVSA